MAERGTTKDCQRFFRNLADTSKVIAEKCGVDQSSLRKFRDSTNTIRRTTFNKICDGLRSHYSVEMVPDDHWNRKDES